MRGVMLVGGFGTRLRPLTITTPKPMLPITNRPLLELELEHLKMYDVDEVVLSTGYMPAVFDEYFGDGSRFGMKLEHVTEDEPLGTCGAVKNVERYLGEGPVVVCNGDILTDLDVSALVAYHREREAAVTITLTPVEDPTAYGLVPLDGDGRIREFLEKPSWDQVVTNMINAGTYVIEPRVFEGVPAGVNYSFERQLFPDLLAAGEPLYGFPSDCYWLDLGTPEKYLKAHHDILAGRIEIPLGGREVAGGVLAGDGLTVEPGAVLEGPAVLGSNVRIGPEARVGPGSTIGDGVALGAGSRVEGSVILDGAVVGEGCVVDRSIVGRKTVLGPGVVVADGSVLGDNIESGGENEFRRGIRVWPSTFIEAGKIRFG